MASLATLATVATIGSAVIGAGAAVYGGYQSKQAAEAAARQDIRAGKNEFAAAQRIAQQRRLEGALILSRQQAVAAASGAGSASDAPTITKVMAETDARYRYGAESELYAGRERQYDYYDSARARRETGQYNFLGGILRGIGRSFEGVGDYYALDLG